MTPDTRPFKKDLHPGLPFICLRTTIFLLLSALLPATLCAQVSQPHRYERQQKNSDDYFNVISLKEEGLALFRERDKYKNNNKIWELILLDTALKERKTLELEIKERYKMLGYEVVPGRLYFLFRTGETTKNDFELVDINLSGEEAGRYSIKPDLDFKLTHFSKAGDAFIFGGYVNNEPTVFIYELPSGLLKVVPGFFQKDTELVDMRVNQNQTFNTVLVDRGTRGERKLMFRTYDTRGELLLEDVVEMEENKTLQTGITSTLEREDLVILGNWGERTSKQSKGFFALNIDPFADQKIHYFSFGQLNHFLDHLNPKRASRIKEDTREDIEAGRTPSYTNYVMPYKIIENKEGYLLLAEVYTPTSNVNPYYSGPYYNPYFSNPYGFGSYFPGYYYPGMSRMYRPYPYGGNVKNSDEIKTNASVLLSFDANGKVRWDQSVKLDEIAVSSLEQVADFCLVNSTVYFLYKKESELKLKSIILEGDEAEEITEKVKTSETADEIRSEREHDGGTRHWYGNAFYVWGYQTIRNPAKEDRLRDVFYINKVLVK